MYTQKKYYPNVYIQNMGHKLDEALNNTIFFFFFCIQLFMETKDLH